MIDFNSMKQSVTKYTNFCNKFITKDVKLHSIFLSIMSFLTELLTNFISISPKNQNPNSLLSSSSNQLAVFKLKGYFDLATEEIDKAVRAEEWRLIDDAVVHYQYAQRILREAIVTCVPSSISSREQEKVKSYSQKISKWQGQVSERLCTLKRRSGSTSTNKKTLPRIQTTMGRSLKPMTRKLVPQSSSGHTLCGTTTRIQSNKETKSKPAQGFDGGLDPKLVEMINSYIVKSRSVKWEDIAGLEKAKQALLEMVILPTKRKDLFTGLRRPPKGLLLFGPPGTGKTMLAKAVASESQATFFNIPPSSVTSKWVGEGEKLVRTLFAVAVARQPSVIFMDEIDSLLSARTSNEHDASRRLKSEFLVQFDGVSSNSNDLVIVIGATNKPHELDDAVLRRLVKRIYIPLPDANVRRSLFKHKLKGEKYSLPSGELERLVKDTEGYTGSDLQALCEEAALMPIRELASNILTVKADQVRRLRYGDFQKAMTVVRPSYLKSKWEELEHWNKEFGSN